MARSDKSEMIAFMKAIKENPQRYYFIQSNITNLKNKGIDISTQGHSGNTLLHLAIQLDNIKLLRMFIKNNVNCDLANDQGEAPIHKAILKGRLDMIKVLVKAGCDVNALKELDESPLHVAVISGRLDILKYLVESGSDILIANENNLLPIDYAIDEKDKDMISYLMVRQEIDEKRYEKINAIL